MNYKLIYDTLVQRGKQRRTKVLGRSRKLMVQ